MSVVLPFRALRYDPERVDLSRVVVPPYDLPADDALRRGEKHRSGEGQSKGEGDRGDSSGGGELARRA